MHFETSVTIAAPPDAVWAVLVDVEQWPQWTASTTRVDLLDDGPLALGSRVRIKQPKLRAAIWEVTALEPGRSFSWTSTNPGVSTVGDHELSEHDGGVTALLRTYQRGWLAPVVGLFVSSLTRRYVEMEAQGLKRRCETSA